MDKRYSQRK